MSNELAIATVTATIQKVLKDAINAKLPGTEVTRGNPALLSQDVKGKRVNVHLCQSTMKVALQNNDLSNSKRPNSALAKQTRTPQDLYYIISFYGDEQKSLPEILLAITLGALLDNVIIEPQMIEKAISEPENQHLLASDLYEQTERIAVEQCKMTKEELAKVWSSYLPLPSPLFIVVEASVVYVEGNKPRRRALPVRNARFYVTEKEPSISQIVSNTGINQPIVRNSILVIHGNNLGSPNSYIKVGDAKLKPQKLDPKEIRFDLSALSNEERCSLRAGVQSLQVFQQVSNLSKYEPQRVIGSNIVPLVLCPKVKVAQATKIEENSDNLCTAEIKVELDLTVGLGQRVLLLLNERSAPVDASYIFNADARTLDNNVVTFSVNDVKKGEYLVRVQVDGAESSLEIDTQPNSETFEQYTSPVVKIE